MLLQSTVDECVKHSRIPVPIFILMVIRSTDFHSNDDTESLPPKSQTSSNDHPLQNEQKMKEK